MGKIGIQEMKMAYVNIIKDKDIEKAKRILNKPLEEPFFTPVTFHPEAEYSEAVLNEMLQDIAVDISTLHAEMDSINEDYQFLMKNTLERLDIVNELLLEEEDRITDINCICNNFDEFISIIPIRSDDVYGEIGVIDTNTFSCFIQEKERAYLEVSGVEGNGYEDPATPNDYIINDANHLVYHYYRNNAKRNNLLKYPSNTNFDNEAAVCTINLQSQNAFNTIKLNVEPLTLQGVYYSQDGIIYNEFLGREIDLTKDPKKKFLDNSFIYGSNVVHIPTTHYAKIQLKSQTKKAIQIEDKEYQTVTGAPTIIRNDISISNVSAYNTTYEKGYFETRELIEQPVSSIAIFASEYLARNIEDQNELIKYFITVNGIEYQITPINQDRPGVKVIRVANNKSDNDTSIILNESIKSAHLKVVIDSPASNISPLVSNIKICLGKAVS